MYAYRYQSLLSEKILYTHTNEITRYIVTRKVATLFAQMECPYRQVIPITQMKLPQLLGMERNR